MTMILEKIASRISSREQIYEEVSQPVPEGIRRIPSRTRSNEVTVTLNPLPELIRQQSLQSQDSGRGDRSTSIDSLNLGKGSFSSDIISAEELILTDEDNTIIQTFIADYKNCKEQGEDFDEKRYVELIQKLLARRKLEAAIDLILRDEIKANKIGLLREESLGAVLLRCYWFHFEGEKYLTTVIKPLIKSVISSTKNKPLEIDPVRLDDPALSEKNLKKLLKLIKDFMTSFVKSADLFPTQFEEVLKNFYTVLTESEGSKKSHLGLGYSEDALRLFGGFLMLRFICPAIVSPTKYGLCKDIPATTQRSLVLISKILQGVANQVEFEGEKEPYMRAANEFVITNMPSMMRFLNDLMDESRGRKRAPSYGKTRPHSPAH